MLSLPEENDGERREPGKAMPADSMVRRADRQARHTRPRAAGDGSQARVCRLSLSPSGAKDRRPGVLQVMNEIAVGQDVWNLETGTGDGSSWLARWCRHERERGTSPNPRAAKTPWTWLACTIPSWRGDRERNICSPLGSRVARARATD